MNHLWLFRVFREIDAFTLPRRGRERGHDEPAGQAHGTPPQEPRREAGRPDPYRHRPRPRKTPQRPAGKPGRQHGGGQAPACRRRHRPRPPSRTNTENGRGTSPPRPREPRSATTGGPDGQRPARRPERHSGHARGQSGSAWIQPDMTTPRAAPAGGFFEGTEAAGKMRSHNQHTTKGRTT